MIRCLLLAAALSLAVDQRPATSPAMVEVERAYQLLTESKFEAARAEFTRLIAGARIAEDHAVIGEASRGLARLASRERKFDEARALLATAVAEADRAGIDYFAGHALNDLGFIAWSEGQPADVRKFYGEAATRFERARAWPEHARALRSKTFASDMSQEEKIALLERSVNIARTIGDATIEAAALHQWGDTLFMQGSYAEAVERIARAVELFEQASDKPALARALTSLGRAHRAHGQPDLALEHYRRALAFQVAAGDLTGQAQSENAIAIAFEIMRRPDDALAHYQRALALAEQSQSVHAIRFQRAQLANGYLGVRRYRETVDTMRQVLADSPDTENYVFYYSYLARGLAGLQQWDEALEAADEAVRAARAPNKVDTFAETLLVRAAIRRDAGQIEPALADAREVLESLEALRAKLVPSDFQKRGFVERFRMGYQFTIALLASTGRHGEALVAAERARGRAFVDLLATKELTVKNGAKLAEAVTSAHVPAVTESGAGALTMRGGSAPAAQAAALDPNLPSLVTVPHTTLETLAATARELDSMLLSYWVDDAAVYVWTVQRDGTVAGARTAITRADLEALVRQTWDTLGDGAASRPARGLTTRGGTKLSVSATRDPYRRLYDLVIAPIEARLPSAAAARITIVPHGPLLGLSFAALLDGRGRYLLERYTLHYAPSVAVLQYAQPPVTSREASRYLLVADPANPGGAGGGLPRLPGARSEAAAVRSLLPAGSATLIAGTGADGPRVKALASGKHVLHFATHGVIVDDRPLDSYLALANGRLTAREIYALNLNADLVILSACRSASGRITGDGIIGLTRAFFYAGTPSIVATLSDVSDVAAGYLVPRFYRSWQRSRDKAAALRAGQLALLRALRAGQVKVQTAAGEFVVPEHPALWSPFVLIGRP